MARSAAGGTKIMATETAALLFIKFVSGVSLLISAVFVIVPGPLTFTVIFNVALWPGSRFPIVQVPVFGS